MIAKNLNRLYPDLNLISSSDAVIDEVEKILEDRDMFAQVRTEEDRFYASDLSENFIRMTDLLTVGTNSRIKLKKMEE